LSSWWWALRCPKHVEQTISFALKNHLLHLVGISFPRMNNDARSNSYLVGISFPRILR
jgi:hypothetical protein